MKEKELALKKVTLRKIVWETISPFDNPIWKNTGKIDENFKWYETAKEVLDLQQFTQLMLWQANREEPIRNVKLYTAEVCWEEVTVEDLPNEVLERIRGKK